MANTKHEKKDSIDEYYEKAKANPAKAEKDADEGKGSGKSGETRLFQTGPDKHESLTRKEAEEKGLHWGDIDSSQVGRSIAPTPGKAPPGHEKG
jgi:hypothetical protein